MIEPNLVLPISNYAYAVYDLTDKDIDNVALAEEIIACSDNRMSDSGTATGNEDVMLNRTPEVLKVEQAVRNVVIDIDPQFDEITHWGHLTPPNESTMCHSHRQRIDPYGVLSWCYWTQIPENSGNLVFRQELPTGESIVEIKPKEGWLILFPGYISHFTQKNCSDQTRVSMSGNLKISRQVRPTPRLMNIIGHQVISPQRLIDLDEIGS